MWLTVLSEHGLDYGYASLAAFYEVGLVHEFMVSLSARV